MRDCLKTVRWRVVLEGYLLMSASSLHMLAHPCTLNTHTTHTDILPIPHTHTHSTHDTYSTHTFHLHIHPIHTKLQTQTLYTCTLCTHLHTFHTHIHTPHTYTLPKYMLHNTLHRNYIDTHYTMHRHYIHCVHTRP